MWKEPFLCGDVHMGRKQDLLTPIEATTGLIIAMINGLLRRRGLKLAQIKGLKETAVEFCRRSLVKTGGEGENL